MLKMELTALFQKNASTVSVFLVVSTYKTAVYFAVYLLRNGEKGGPGQY